MPSPPSGTITFLFTDIEGSIRLRYGGTDEGSSGSESSSGWNDLVGWIEEQGEEDTQGFAFKSR